MSINTQVVVNHRGAFTHISARFPGGTHDSRVLQESYLQDVLDRNILGQYYLLGDQGYKCQTNLITPYSTWPHKPSDEEAYFNECLAKTRVKVECVIGMWKKKFPVLAIPSHYQPEVLCDVIRACAFLWNFGLLSGDNKGYDPDTYVVKDKDILDARLHPTVSGTERRDILKEYLWSNRARRNANNNVQQ